MAMATSAVCCTAVFIKEAQSSLYTQHENRAAITIQGEQCSIQCAWSILTHRLSCRDLSSEMMLQELQQR